MTERDRRDAGDDDELLSRLLDGDLDDGPRAALRARIAAEPALAARLAELAAADGALRSVPLPPVRAAVREGLARRIADLDAPAPGVAAQAAAAPTGAARAPVVALDAARAARRRVRTVLVLGGALAAALALWIAVGGAPRLAPPGAPVDGARDDASLAREDAPPRDAVPDVAPDVAPDVVPDGASPAPSPVDPTALAARAADAGDAAAARSIAEPTDAELALARDLDALRDFDVIDQLELLELLAQIESGGASG